MSHKIDIIFKVCFTITIIFDITSPWWQLYQTRQSEPFKDGYIQHLNHHSNQRCGNYGPRDSDAEKTPQKRLQRYKTVKIIVLTAERYFLDTLLLKKVPKSHEYKTLSTLKQAWLAKFLRIVPFFKFKWKWCPKKLKPSNRSFLVHSQLKRGKRPTLRQLPIIRGKIQLWGCQMQCNAMQRISIIVKGSSTN